MFSTRETPDFDGLYRPALVEKYRLDSPMGSREMRAHLHNLVVSEYRGEIFDSKELELFIVHSLKLLLQVQVEARGIPVDFELIDELASSFKVSIQMGRVNIAFAVGWDDKIDVALHNWTCSSCGEFIYGDIHPSDECDATVLKSVMDS